MEWHTFLIAALALVIFGIVVFRIPVRRDYLRRGKLTILSSVLETSVFCLFGIVGWQSMPWHYPHPSVPQPLVILAWVVMIVGLLGLVVAMARLGMPRSLGHGKSELLEAGFYRFTRNPQVVFCAGFVIGNAVLCWTWYALGHVILYSVLTHTMVVTEEEHLLRKFGDQYKDYCRRVPRYIGLKRRSQGV